MPEGFGRRGPSCFVARAHPIARYAFARERLTSGPTALRTQPTEVPGRASTLAKEVGASGVRVNLVSPGLILTPEVEQHYLEIGRRKGWGETWQEIEPRVARDAPIGRIARREEIADLVVFLCSPRADAIHGQNIRVDGGALGIVT
jgi:hypothetical protein